MNQELTTERLHLVPCNEGHLDGLCAINSDPTVMRYITGRPETRADTQRMIERVKARWGQWGYSWWTIIERESAEIVGAGCIQNLRKSGIEPDTDCPLEIGWRIRADKWRRGYASEAARAMADFAFVHLRANLLYAVCNPQNSASIGVMRKLGMRYRGEEDWYAQTVTTYELSRAVWEERSVTASGGATRPP